MGQRLRDAGPIAAAVFLLTVYGTATLAAVATIVHFIRKFW